MKIYFRSNGEILRATYDSQVFLSNLVFNVPYLIYEIDELEENMGLCKDVAARFKRLDDVGDPKYYMYDNSGTWELHEKDGWVQAISPEEPD